MSETFAQDPYAANLYSSLRQEMIDTVAQILSPLALQSGYTDIALDQKIKWQPTVLVIGNYSSGKSTLINELLGCDVQRMGQAPTDDCFTVLSYGEDQEVEERDGQVLVSSDIYPFHGLKKHGQRFIAHFRLKKVKAEILKNIAVIDTPGMLDSVAERDRGYDYQAVIQDLAELADLVIVLFDPHKAGTIRETYESLRQTLPAATSEDRVLFALSRTDECQNLQDLLRVYGTLCWNLSQMTGRKDIPHIYLTWAQQSGGNEPEFLKLLVNQRPELMAKVAMASKYRLDHLAAFVDGHEQALSMLYDASYKYKTHERLGSAKVYGYGGVLLLLGAGGLWWSGVHIGLAVEAELLWAAYAIGSLVILQFMSWVWQGLWRRRVLSDSYLVLARLTQQQRTTWQTVEGLFQQTLQDKVAWQRLSTLKRARKQLGTVRHRLQDWRRVLSQ